MNTFATTCKYDYLRVKAQNELLVVIINDFAVALVLV